jgi:uncharacterized protein YndB with AHSA1/START domain
MRDIVQREVDIPCPPEEVWEYVTDPAWLGSDGTLDLVPGGEGRVTEAGTVRFITVEEVEPAQRLVFRWASFQDEPSRVEIELEPVTVGTRIVITEVPIGAKAQALVTV